MHAHAWAPCRIGIAGGGTDLPAWTRERPGRCLSLAIKIYTHAFIIARPDGQVVASYRHRDEAAYATEIANGLVRESALLHGWESGFEVHTISEVSSQGSGLGVSSSIAVALSAAFARMTLIAKEGADGEIPRQAVARSAWTVEIDRLRRPIGRQDHMAAAYGGLRLYGFEKDRAQVDRDFSEDDAAWVAAHLALVQLPEGHDARTILSGVQRAGQIQAAYDAVDAALQAVRERRVDLLGEALSAGQRSKASIPGAVPRGVEMLVQEISARPGVHGCKVAGAGGGGHLVIACDPDATFTFPVIRVRPDFFGVRSDGCA